MPRGVYVRRMTPKQVASMRRNLAKGRTKKIRAKAAATLRRIAADPNWRIKVSEATKRALSDPDVRKRIKASAKKRMALYGSNFKGGNGQEPVSIQKFANTVFKPLGFLPELPVKTKGHKTKHNAPTSYKVDLGHPYLKVAIELDGPSHRRSTEARDQKKQEVLESLGWTVIRIRHK